MQNLERKIMDTITIILYYTFFLIVLTPLIYYTYKGGVVFFTKNSIKKKIYYFVMLMLFWIAFSGMYLVTWDILTDCLQPLPTKAKVDKPVKDMVVKEIEINDVHQKALDSFDATMEKEAIKIKNRNK